MFSFFSAIISFIGGLLHWIASLFPFLVSVISAARIYLTELFSGLPAPLLPFFTLLFAYFVFDFIRGR